MPTIPNSTSPPPDDGPDWRGSWDFSKGIKGQRIPGVQQIAINPDGRTVAVTVNEEDENKNVKGDLHLVSRDGKPLTGWPKSVGPAEGVAFSPDGLSVAVAIRPDGVVRLFRVADGKPVPVAKAELRAVSAVQFSDDGEWMAAAGFTDTGAVVRFWQRDGERGWVSPHPDASAPENQVWAFRFAPGRTVVALAVGQEKAAGVYLFDAATGREVKRFALNRKDLGPTVAFAANAPLLAASSFGEVLLFRVPDWEAVGKPLLMELDRVPTDLRVLALSPDGKWVAGGRDTDLHLWKVEGGATVRHQGNWWAEEADRHTRTVTTLAFTPDGKRLLSGGEDGKVIVHDHAELFRGLSEGKP